MTTLPKFSLYGEDDPNVDENIQPSLALRRWGDLPDLEKKIAYRQLANRGWLDEHSPELLATIEYMNDSFLRQCPGTRLHAIKPARDYQGNRSNDSERQEAALLDFQHIFLKDKSEAMVLRMLSKFLSCYIDRDRYRIASNTVFVDEQMRMKFIEDAFKKFDKLAHCLNRIFEQFAVNVVVTRNGFVPRQDGKITKEVYEPTLRVLSDPKWKSVNSDVAKMFEDYREQNYAEAITKAHAVVQRFLQILVGEEGKNAKGEVGDLFKEAKKKGLIPATRITEQFIMAIQSHIVSERATNSTAKPALKDATASDALLMMNLVMIFLQHCLQN